MNAVLALLVMVIVGFLLRGYLQRAARIAPEEAKRLMQRGATLLDVRERAEFSGGHLPAAMCIPLGDLDKRFKSLGKREHDLIVYCQEGDRSLTAVKLLKGAGFTRVHNLGPMERWTAKA